jgi:thioredoxin-like negative regulator of GroEL
MHKHLATAEALNTLIQDEPAVLIYFFSPGCGVCQVLKPRITALLAEQFPRIVFAEVDCTAAPALAALHQVFSVPVVLLFLEGRESSRWVRNLHLNELREQLVRPYSLLFGGAS